MCLILLSTLCTHIFSASPLVSMRPLVLDGGRALSDGICQDFTVATEIFVFLYFHRDYLVSPYLAALQRPMLCIN